MKCPFCPIRSEDSRLLASHIKAAHADKTQFTVMAQGFNGLAAWGRSRPGLELPVVEIDIDAIHRKPKAETSKALGAG
jgi:hypothetical protein